MPRLRQYMYSGYPAGGMLATWVTLIYPCFLSCFVLSVCMPVWMSVCSVLSLVLLPCLLSAIFHFKCCYNITYKFNLKELSSVSAPFFCTTCYHPWKHLPLSLYKEQAIIYNWWPKESHLLRLYQFKTITPLLPGICWCNLKSGIFNTYQT